MVERSLLLADTVHVETCSRQKRQAKPLEQVAASNRTLCRQKGPNKANRNYQHGEYPAAATRAGSRRFGLIMASLVFVLIWNSGCYI